MKTSERLSQVEARVKSAFSISDARANIAVTYAPSPGDTPAAKIAAAIKADAVQAAAPDAVARIRDGLKSALASAEAEINAVADEASTAHVLASFIVGKAPELPASIPDHLKAAALTLKGQPGAGPVARQLILAAENAEMEIARLRERWLPRTKLAADQAAYNHAHRIFKAAGLERKAQAAELLARRARQKRHEVIETNSRRRLSDV